MGGLRDQFLRFYETSEDVRRSALSEGLIAFDTNVILSLYRFLPDARDELFVVMEQLEDRLWIPHQVALEFHQNRLNVIAQQEAFYGEVRSDLNKAGTAYIEKLNTFSSRVGLSREAVGNLAERVQKAHDAVDEQIGLLAEQANPVRLYNHKADRVLARLEALLEGRVGEPLSPNLHEEALKEAKRRLNEKIPPGYMDRGKPNPHGDYLIWVQLKYEAAKRERPTVLVTDDKKEDWFQRTRGFTLGPRVELHEEMEKEARVPFVLMTTESFLLQAQEFISVEVSPATVDQAKGLPLRDSTAEERLDQALLDDEQDFLRDAETRAYQRARDFREGIVAIEAALAEGEIDSDVAQEELRDLYANYQTTQDLIQGLTTSREEVRRRRIELTKQRIADAEEDELEPAAADLLSALRASVQVARLHARRSSEDDVD